MILAILSNQRFKQIVKSNGNYKWFHYGAINDPHNPWNFFSHEWIKTASFFCASEILSSYLSDPWPFINIDFFCSPGLQQKSITPQRYSSKVLIQNIYLNLYSRGGTICATNCGKSGIFSALHGYTILFMFDAGK